MSEARWAVQRGGVVLAISATALACRTHSEERVSLSRLQSAAIESVVALDATNGAKDIVYCVAVAEGGQGVDPTMSMESAARATGRRVLSMSACAAERGTMDTLKIVALHLISADTSAATPSATLSTIRPGAQVTEYQCTAKNAGGIAKAVCQVAGMS